MDVEVAIEVGAGERRWPEWLTASGAKSYFTIDFSTVFIEEQWVLMWTIHKVKLHGCKRRN